VFLSGKVIPNSGVPRAPEQSIPRPSRNEAALRSWKVFPYDIPIIPGTPSSQHLLRKLLRVANLRICSFAMLRSRSLTLDKMPPLIAPNSEQLT